MSSSEQSTVHVNEDIRRVLERFPGKVEYAHGFRLDDTLVVDKDAVLDVMRFLKDDPGEGFDFLVDLAGADHLELEKEYPERYEVVYHLLSRRRNRRLRVKARIHAEDAEAALRNGHGVIESLTQVWAGADWMEREVYDMFGIRFKGHPNLKRILCHEAFVGHALRKDYPLKRGQWLETPADLSDELGEPGYDEEDLFHDMMEINIGPAHPAMHGTFRVMARLEGETIVRAACEIGYLHRAFEKSAEKGTYTQVIPYTDRLNYCSALLNNVAYCRAVEKLLGIQVPERARYIRIIIAELSRIIDHLVCVGANLVDMGALTNFWYTFSVREDVYEVLESLTGHRLTNNYVRIGGLAYDLYDGFDDHVRYCLGELKKAIHDVLRLVKRNRIFIDRTRGVGVISPEDALSFGWTGPCLRAAGVPWDLRKHEPYDGYDEFDFEVPVLDGGDTHDRILIRFLEMEQSARIIEQALERLPGGPVNTEERRVSMPPKPGEKGALVDIESLMNHFVLVYEGIKPPKGEVYCPTEAPNGELGFYIVSDGSGRPYRVRVRPPCFLIYSAFPHIIKGAMVADAVITIGSLNVIAGELDR